MIENNGKASPDSPRPDRFLFSVIMAVYNVAPFVREAVESLVSQNIGFENIQVIMVDDGSTDGSGQICDEYAAKYPANVVVLHQENKGVSAARNSGLEYACGTYLTFVDPDDRLSGNALKKVADFFKRNEQYVDVVAIPMFFFDGQTGPHILNYKFKKGTRVINLRKEYDAIQLSTSSAFFKRSVFQELDVRFDSQTMFTEDAKLLVPILCQKMRIGVVSDCKYLYRKRSEGQQSASQQSCARREWWNATLCNFHAETISWCEDNMGYIPKFVQYLLAYDIQWRVDIAELPETLLTKEEGKEYIALLSQILQSIDDNIIFEQKSIFTEHKKYLLELKYGKDCCCLSKDKTLLYCANTDIASLAYMKTVIDFLLIEDDVLHIEGFNVLLPANYEAVCPALRINGEVRPCSSFDRNRDQYALGTKISESLGFTATVALGDAPSSHDIELGLLVDGIWVRRERLGFGKFMPFSKESNTVWNLPNGWSVRADKACLSLCRSDASEQKKNERTLRKGMLKSRKASSVKAACARIAYGLARRLVRKPIWIITDRIDRAGDNGEAFFTYLCQCAKDKVRPVFAIDRRSDDFERLLSVGSVVGLDTWRYKMLFLLASCICSSQADEQVLRPFREFSHLYQDLIYRKPFVFLQHGVTQNDLTALMNRYSKNVAIFVTTTRPEYNSILSYPYFYTDDQVRLTGFPRYDLLEDAACKCITIMPTWRSKLVGRYDEETGGRLPKAGFQSSEYYQMYKILFNDTNLFEAAEKYGYTIRLMMHPNMTSVLGLFERDERLEIVPAQTAYRDVFAESSLIVTDYSSVAFDFAYLRKPVVYYQADREDFFAGGHTLNKGYFDYERDGFGEVVFREDDLANLLVEYMQNNCQLKERYRERIDATFPFNDRNNCKRVYEAMCAKGYDRVQDAVL